MFFIAVSSHLLIIGELLPGKRLKDCLVDIIRRFDMSLISKLEKKEVKELLGKCWMTHDGMWFYHTMSEVGIEKANWLNKSAIESLAPIEIKRLKKAMNLPEDHFTTFEGVKNFFMNVADFLIPDFMNVQISFLEPNTITWSFNEKKCFAYNGINMIGVIDEYECGVLYRIKCWLTVLGIKFEMEPEVYKCIMPARGECSGQFTLLFD